MWTNHKNRNHTQGGDHRGHDEHCFGADGPAEPVRVVRGDRNSVPLWPYRCAICGKHIFGGGELPWTHEQPSEQKLALSAVAPAMGVR